MFTGNLTFATVHYAGHEVPAYQPERALHLFNSYLSGEIFSDAPVTVETTSSASETTTTARNFVSAAIAALLVITAFGGLIICFLPRNSKKSINSLEEIDVDKPNM
jgi:hypothetical protein